MGDEQRHLGEQKSSLEDEELELMEVMEQRQGVVARLEDDARALAGDISNVQKDIAAGEEAVGREISAAQAKRDEVKGRVLAPLLSRYETLRPKLGGVAIAAVENGKCGGCHLLLSQVALDQLHKASDDEMITCEECGRLLAH